MSPTFPSPPPAPATVVNPFDPAATMKQVFATMDEAFAAIPNGHTHAIVIDGNYSQHDGPSARVAFVQKVNDGWNVIVDGGYDGPHGASGGVQLAKSW